MVGILPDKLLSDKLKYVNEDMLKIGDGISPYKEAFFMLNFSSFERFPISAGIPPEITKGNEKPCINNYTIYIYVEKAFLVSR